jgi:RNA polymerase II subunit A small phosphatase-like protein
MMQPLLIVWDLDETLIHCDDDFDVDRDDPDFTDTSDGDNLRFFVRPGARDIVQKLENDDRFIQGVFTAASQPYAKLVVSNVWPAGTSPVFLFARDRVTQQHTSMFGHETSTNQLKDLKKVHKLGYDLSRTLAIDDKPSVYARHYGNTIHIPAYLGEKQDDALSLLSKYLETFAPVENVRHVEKRGWYRRVNQQDFSHLTTEPGLG